MSFASEYDQTTTNQKLCDFDTLPNAGQVCKLDLSKFEKCTKAHDFGYNNSAPCIFLKLNRIFGWEPDYYSDPKDLPNEMPEDLKAHIRKLLPDHRKQVWVTCYGENGADREILGDVEYYPTRGFPSYFYPYTNIKGYLSPLVAVKFTRPKREYSSNILSLQITSDVRSGAENFNKNSFFSFISHLARFISESNHKYRVSGMGEKYKLCWKSS